MMSDKKKSNDMHWTGSFGFIMASAGAAIGMGNLWRFQRWSVKNGGGAFVLIYLICVVVIGIPMLMAEISIGRHSGKDAWGSYGSISRPWRFLGLFCHCHQFARSGLLQCSGRMDFKIYRTERSGDFPGDRRILCGFYGRYRKPDYLLHRLYGDHTFYCNPRRGQGYRKSVQNTDACFYLYF